MKISIVMPVYNEKENLHPLFGELFTVLEGLGPGFDYEILAVNDASRDESLSVLKEAVKINKRVKVIDFIANCGQTAALSAGFEYASGDIIIPIDSDRENDPRDIVRLLDKMQEGYDVVSGWRKDRWREKRLSRKLPSILANFLISKITGLNLHDYGCTLKAYKKEVIAGVRLYGEMHRFIPAYALWRGARVAEITVNYRQRTKGKSKYGIGRTFSVLLDLVVIKFLDKYLNKPMHFFGGIGFIAFFFGLITGFAALVLKILGIRSLVETPLPILAALFIMVGVQLIVMGIIGEMLTRTYYESQNKRPYGIKEKINF